MHLAHPVALADQLDAATRDAQHAFSTFTAKAGMDVLDWAASEWFTGRFASLMLALLDGDAERCAHLAAGPRPAVAALWHPGRVVCRACMPQLGFPEHGPVCDRCATAPEYLAFHAVQIDTLMVLYALCEPCDALDTAEPGPLHSAGRA